MSPRLPRSVPEMQGVSTDGILAFLHRVQNLVNSLHSFMLLRHGAVIGERWWHPYRPDAPHMLFSLSKSFTSTAVGLAVAEGRLSVADPVLKFFPADAPAEVSPNLAAMQVRHLLSMSTGHHLDSTDRMIFSPQPVKAFLELPVEHEPGTFFVYNSGATFILSAIVQKLTGQTVCDYLGPRLFQPLGIRHPYWESHPNGVNFGGWGLNITTEDIACFGQLYLQDGVWQGRRLIPAGWVSEATGWQVSNEQNTNPDWRAGYGYQFWRCRHNAYRGDGAFGQFCVVMPDQDAVLAITAGVPDMQIVLDLAWETLLPAMSNVPVSAPVEGRSVALPELELPKPHGDVTSPAAAAISGKTFILEPNSDSLESICLDFERDTLTYRLLGADALSGQHQIRFGYERWIDGIAPLRFLEGAREKAAACGAWTAPDTFSLVVCLYETPFTLTLVCQFDGETVRLVVKQNVSFGPTDHPPINGRLAG